MNDVTRIYNQEIGQGWRALDQEPQTVQAFITFLRFCCSENIPFIVAMSEYRNPNIPIEEVDHRVIGFAFLDVASRGIFGSTRSIGQHSGRLYVMVDSTFRRNRVGTALIDRMLITTSRGYLPKELSYQFLNPNNDPAYQSELYNPREWRIVLMEVYVENLGNIATTKAGQEYQFIRQWLETEFRFTFSTYTSNFGIADCLDDQKYVDRLLLEYRCRDSDGNWGPRD
jgi:hypothetical protein